MSDSLLSGLPDAEVIAAAYRLGILPKIHQKTTEGWAIPYAYRVEIKQRRGEVEATIKATHEQEPIPPDQGGMEDR